MTGVLAVAEKPKTSQRGSSTVTRRCGMPEEARTDFTQREDGQDGRRILPYGTTLRAGYSPRYEVGSLLRETRMSEVYLAREIPGDRMIIIKVAKDNPDSIAALRNEAETLAMLRLRRRITGIEKMYFAGLHQRRLPYLVLEMLGREMDAPARLCRTSQKFILNSAGHLQKCTQPDISTEISSLPTCS